MHRLEAGKVVRYALLALAVVDTTVLGGVTPLVYAIDPPLSMEAAVVRDVELHPIPSRVLAVCHAAEISYSVRLLCPTRLPQASEGYPEQPPPPIAASHADDELIIQFGYGAPNEKDQERNTPDRFLHFAILTGRDAIVRAPGDWKALGDRVIRARRGALYHVPPSAAAGLHRNHLVFSWREDGTLYSASLHVWKLRATVRLLDGIVASLDVVGPQPEPSSFRPARPIVQVRTGDPVTDVASGAGSVWLVSYQQSGRVIRINAQTARITGMPIPIGNYPFQGIAVGRDSVWVANTRENFVTRLNSKNSRVVADRIPVGDSPLAVVVGRRYVWVANYGDGTLSRIDPQTNHVVGRPRTVARGPNRLAIAFGSVWITDFDAGQVVRVDEESGDVLARIPAGHGLSAVAAGPDAIWVTDWSADDLLRIDPSVNQIVSRISVGPAPSDVAVRGGSVWVPDYWEGTLRLINAKANVTTERMAFGQGLWHVVTTRGHVWALDTSGVLHGVRLGQQSRGGNGGVSWLAWLAVGMAAAVLALLQLLRFLRRSRTTRQAA